MIDQCLPVLTGNRSGDDHDMSTTSANSQQSCSPVFRSRCHHDISSLSSASSSLSNHLPSLPVDPAVCRPFKPVRHNLQTSVKHPPLFSVSSECPLPPAVHTTANSFRMNSPRSPPGTASSECPLPSNRAMEQDSPNVLETCSPHTSSADSPTQDNDSGSEEDPTIESKHRSDTLRSPAPKLSAATRISMALSKHDSMQKTQSDPGLGCRDVSLPKCYLGASTRISMAVSAQKSKIGRRLSTMLHNSRLCQSLSPAGM